MSASRPFPSLPSLAPHGGRREEDDGLDALETPEARLQDGYRAATPSVVIAPDAQVAPPPEPRLKRGGQEPTLVIRDRRRVDSLRAEMRRRASVGERYRSFFLWTGAGLGAFALGVGVVAALGQRSGNPAAAAAEPSVAQGSALKSDSVPVPRAPVVVPAASVQAPAAPSAPALVTEKGPAADVPNERVATPPVVREASPKAPSPTEDEAVPAEKAGAKRPSNVVSLDELPGE